MTGLETTIEFKTNCDANLVRNVLLSREKSGKQRQKNVNLDKLVQR